MNNRVVITGMGMVSSLGLSVEENWQNLIEGRSGISHTSFDSIEFDTRIAGEVKGLDPSKYVTDRKELKIMDKHSYMTIAATEMALKDAKIHEGPIDPSRFGIFMGLGMIDYEIEYLEEAARASTGEGKRFDLMKFGDNGYRMIFPLRNLQLMGNITLGQIAKSHNVQGPNMVLSPFAESGAQAIGEAMKVVRRGEADLMIAGGCSLKVNPACFARFTLSRMMTKMNDPPQRASRPFDRKRDGFVLGEGAGVIILEGLAHASKRDAPVYGELKGYGVSFDPSKSGSDSTRIAATTSSMNNAVRAAGTDSAEIGYINADARSDQKGDMIESESIKKIFGENTRIPISSTKSMMGHLLGGSGPVELIVCLLALKQGVIPPTINYEYPDPACDLYYVPNSAIEKKANVALSNSFGFGGQHITLIVKKI
ncbi:MAG: beta-ketoacyl-[acyl-carrier-protein] synthase family protein [Promethearchaeota archaeon]|jgi:3-oxoacyl-[acyl-carrier-protein] synthase II